MARQQIGAASLAIGAGVLGIAGIMYYSATGHKVASNEAAAHISAKKIGLQCRDLSVKLTTKQKDVQILDDVNLTVNPGTITAIIGPSGGGKTTLLNVLASRLKFDKKLQVQGTLDVTNNSAPHVLHPDEVGYVFQEDVLFSHLTVRETLETAVQLRSMRSGTTSDPASLAELVDKLLRTMDLTHVQSTIVGNVRERGISGGEKKRVSIACELVGSPSILFLDEPTTGLDSFQAAQVIQTLRKLCDDAGTTVVLSLHQPREQIFAMLDTLVVLNAEGMPMFTGDQTSVAGFFQRLGHPIPPQCNPPDFILDLVSFSEDTADNSNCRERCASFRAANRAQVAESQSLQFFRRKDTPAGVPEPAQEEGKGRRVLEKWTMQLPVLMFRNWRQLVRDRRTLRVRLSSTLGASAVFGLLYYGLGDNKTQASILSRQGLLQVLVNYTAMTSLVKTVNAFGKERALAERELGSGLYDATPYLAAKVVSELPVAAFFPMLVGVVVYPLAGLQCSLDKFLSFSSLMVLQSLSSASLGLAFGAALPSEAALEAGKATMMMSIIFGGFYFSPQTLPYYLQWIPETSLVKAGFEALLANELGGLTFTGEPFATGEQVLAHLGVGASVAAAGGSAAEVVANVVSSGLRRGLLVVAMNYAATYGFLVTNQPRFIKLPSS